VHLSALFADQKLCNCRIHQLNLHTSCAIAQTASADAEGEWCIAYAGGMTVPPLPEAFIARVSGQLGSEAAAFLATYEQRPTYGLRINPAKTSLDRLRALTGWALESIPWCPTGAYVDPADRAGAHPYHAAGLYYLQEPTAMAVAELARLEPGQRVLDLAAAPGGKATQAASSVGPEGLLVANEIHAGRIKPLGENLERWGATQAVITNTDPEQLRRIGPVFDRVIVDAPCSGEGLFRREPEARAEWSPARVAGSAERQAGIVAAAVDLVRPGGLLVYSTCTFNERENECVVEGLLAARPEWHVDERLRLWPHRVRGEGHVVTRLVRWGDGADPVPMRVGIPDEPDARAAWDLFAQDHFDADPISGWPGRLVWRGDRLMLATDHALDLSGVPVVRDGLWLGERKPGRFEPSHALALAIDPATARNRLDLDVAGARRWIAGEPAAAAGPGGWVLVTVDGFGLGWGKRTGGAVKNHYPKGLRRAVR
jgi:16S rRNA C967 or C1407 C5-methylase (RsmB/RsmF family)/NOL1/NOP2/fmu family ribosome biogenesis protein